MIPMQADESRGENGLHPALWLARALLSRGGLCFLGLRAAWMNWDKRTNRVYSDVLLARNIRSSEIIPEWETWLYPALRALNQSETRPAEVVFNINPQRRESANRAHKRDPYPYWNLALRLPLDTYGRESRLWQVELWREHGLAPSILLDGGDSIYPVWCLSTPLPNGDGGALMERLSALAEGACEQSEQFQWWNSANWVPAPGFPRPPRKRDGAWRSCAVIHPDLSAEPQRLDPELFAAFPPSSQKDMRRFFAVAGQMPGSVEENIRATLRRSAEEARRQTLPTLAQALLDYGRQVVQSRNIRQMVKLGHDWKPRYDKIPFALDIRWKIGKESWMGDYCMRGFSGYAQGDLDVISRASRLPPVRAALDMAVVTTLARMEYTRDALLEFATRPDTLFLHDKGEAEIRALYDEAYARIAATLNQYLPAGSQRPAKHKELMRKKKVKIRSSFTVDGDDKKK